MGYTLKRTLPSGEVKSQGPVKRARDAATLAAFVLYDNALASKADAQCFAGVLYRAGEGMSVTHMPSGYVFCIERGGECACCGKAIAGADRYEQPDGTVKCGNCDGNEQPGCPNCMG